MPLAKKKKKQWGNIYKKIQFLKFSESSSLISSHRINVDGLTCHLNESINQFYIFYYSFISNILINIVLHLQKFWLKHNEIQKRKDAHLADKLKYCAKMNFLLSVSCVILGFQDCFVIRLPSGVLDDFIFGLNKRNHVPRLLFRALKIPLVHFPGRI